ncbi:MAG: phytoene/squalene synthase family protein [Bacteroidales bacterium]
MPSDQTLSPAAELLRRHDRERFVTALFAPPEAREGLMALYAFNVELSRVRESVREAMAGMIRLQWWREVLDGRRDEEAARHPVAAPLLQVVRARELPLTSFEQILTAREKDLVATPFATQLEFECYAFETAGLLAELAVAALGARDESSRAAAQFVGQAWAITGLMRALPVHLGQGWMTLPEDMLVQAGSSQQELGAGQTSPAALAAVLAELGRRARWYLREARRHRPPRRAVPVLLQATQASVHLRALERAGWNAFDASVLRPRPMPLRLACNAMLGRY